ncbi:MAG: GNAT family N-acetyltransferase [Acidobacteriota bacterium]
MEIKIKEVTKLEDLKKILTIQKEAWQFDPIEIVPIPLFILAKKWGGIVLGAYSGNELIGFVYSFPLIHEKKLIQHSHMLAVLPEYRKIGIGLKLKLKQREFAIKKGYDAITWTFDPLQLINCYLNFHKLGVICNTYLPNFYGITSSPLHHGIPTDRLLAWWNLKEKRTCRIIRGNYKNYNAEDYKKCLEIDENFKIIKNMKLKGKVLLAQVPENAEKIIIDRGLKAILNFQKILRETLINYFKNGYKIVDFIKKKNKCFFVLEKRIK